MKQATLRKSKDIKTLNLNMKHRMREGLLIFLLAVSAYLLLALATYHSSDPGWSSSGMGGFVANAGGRVGAYLADVFVTLFGYMAYLFPIMLAVSAWLILVIGKSEEEGGTRYTLLRLSGFLLTLLSGCGLVELIQYFQTKNLFPHAGGILGNIIDNGLINSLNLVGTRLILLTFLLIGVTLFTGLSWLFILENLGKWLIFLSKQTVIFLNFLKEKIGEFLDEHRDKKWFKIKPPVVINSSEKTGPSPEHLIEMKSVEIEEKISPVKRKKPVVDITHVEVSGDLPSLSLLDEPQKLKKQNYSAAEIDQLSKEIEKRLLDFEIQATVVAAHPGPVITRFELELAPGLKVNKITALVKDLARALSVSSVRVVEVIPGKSVIGLEIPNEYRQIVYIKELFEADLYQQSSSPLSLALGKDTSGYPVVVDLAKMPHVLIAGTTGSGKSMCINDMLFSILFKSTPKEVRFIMIDPKMLELSVYDGIPHLLTPVVTNMKEAANAFRWCIGEMERRYQLLASLGVRNLDGYNEKIQKAINEGKPLKDPLVEIENEEAPTLNTLPYIVIVVDELADLMMVSGRKVEELITRIAQKARAVGLHMILATQRPSVDVITGLIKANIPTRVSFQVSSRIDSRTILDQQGAEQLLGYGDMLYLPPGTSHPIRVHGGYVADDEAHRVVGYLKKQGKPDYHEEILEDAVSSGDGLGSDDGEADPLYDQAVSLVLESRRASISYVQRRLKIGYNRAARLLEAMEAAGVVSEMGANGSREILETGAPPIAE